MVNYHHEAGASPDCYDTELITFENAVFFFFHPMKHNLLKDVQEGYIMSYKYIFPVP